MSLAALMLKTPINPDYHGMQVWNSELHIQSPDFGKDFPSLASTTAGLAKELPAVTNSTVQLGSQFVALSMTAGAVNVAESAFGIQPSQQTNPNPNTVLPKQKLTGLQGPAMNMGPKPPSFDSVS